MKKNKVLLITYPNVGGLATLDAFAQAKDIEIVGIVLSDRVFKNHSYPQLVSRLIKTTGFRFTWWLFYSSDLLFVPLSLFKKPSLLHSSIPVHKTKDVNSHDTSDFIADLSPDYIASCMCNQVISQDIARLSKIECVNVHDALLPKSRGMFSSLRRLANRDNNAGATIHRIEDGIDTGLIYYQEPFKTSSSNLLDLEYETWHQCATILARWLSNQDKFTFKSIRQDHLDSDYHSWPSTKEISDFVSSSGRLGGLLPFLKLSAKIFRS